MTADDRTTCVAQACITGWHIFQVALISFYNYEILKNEIIWTGLLTRLDEGDDYLFTNILTPLSKPLFYLRIYLIDPSGFLWG